LAPSGMDVVVDCCSWLHHCRWQHSNFSLITLGDEYVLFKAAQVLPLFVIDFGGEPTVAHRFGVEPHAPFAYPDAHLDLSSDAQARYLAKKTHTTTTPTPIPLVVYHAVKPKPKPKPAPTYFYHQITLPPVKVVKGWKKTQPHKRGTTKRSTKQNLRREKGWKDRKAALVNKYSGKPEEPDKRS